MSGRPDAASGPGGDAPPDVDADLLAGAFGLAAADVPGLMRAGAITARVYRGEGEDAGTWLCHVFHRNARLALVLADDGRVLRRTQVDFGDRPLPASLRRP